MNIGLTTDLDTSRFVSMLRDLMQISGKDFKTVLLSQTAAILKFCIKHTRAASRGKILRSISARHSTRYTFPTGEVISESKRHPGHISFLDTSTARGSRPPRTVVGGKTWHDMTNYHWSDVRWAKYQAFLAEAQARTKGRKAGSGADEKNALASRGLAKHSWYAVAEIVGIAAQVDAPAWVKSAAPQNGRNYDNAAATVALEASQAYIELHNSYPAAVRMDGQALINFAIVSRALAFEREVEKGVFLDLKTRAQRYPGIFVYSAS